MAEKRTESFTVTDRRLFTAEGELRKETSEEQEVAAAPKPAAVAESAPATKAAETVSDSQMPAGPSAAEQEVQADAYRASSAEMDRHVEAAGQSAKDLEITFERFLASLYMTGMLQLGLMREQGGPPQLDLIGARQTIDSLALLAEKTKGNLTLGGTEFSAERALRNAHGLCGSDQRHRERPAAGSNWAVHCRAIHKMKATLTVLGSGTSMGVPTIGCDCAVCHSSDPRDRRTRPSVMIEYGGRAVLIDTTPDFREQAIRENIRRLDAVLYTHTHADHILGIDDLRPLSFLHKPGRLPLYAHPEAAEFIRKMFRYIFDADYKFGGLAAGGDECD